MSELKHQRVRVGTQIVSFHIPKNLLKALDRLVEEGIFNNRSEAIRMAVLKLILEYANAFNDGNLITSIR